MLVSVIIPAYNTEKYIGRCMDSVCMQTYKDIEIIVVDDASTDGTLRILREYADRDSRVRIISQPKNRGNGIGRNTAIKESQGEYVMFVDSDDKIVPRCVEKLVSVANGSEPDMVIYGYQNVSLSEKNKRNLKNKVLPTLTGNESHDELLHNFLVFGKNVKMSPWQYFCRKDFLLHHDISFDDTGCYFEDVIFTTKLFYFVHDLKVVAEPLYFYTTRLSSIMNTFSKKKIQDRIYVFNSVRSFLKQNESFVTNKDAYTYFFVHSVFLMSFFDLVRMKNVDGEAYEFIKSFASSDLVYNYHQFDIQTLKSDDMDKRDWNYIKFVRGVIYFISHHFNFAFKYYRFRSRIGKLL